MQRFFGSKSWAVHQEPKGKHVSGIGHTHCVSSALRVAAAVVGSCLSECYGYSSDVKKKKKKGARQRLCLSLTPFLTSISSNRPPSDKRSWHGIGQNGVTYHFLKHWLQKSLEEVSRVEGTLGLTENPLQFANIQQDMSRAIKASNGDSCITRLA